MSAIGVEVQRAAPFHCLKIDVTARINEQFRQEKSPCCAENWAENHAALHPGVEWRHLPIILNVEAAARSNEQVCHSLLPSANRNMQRRRTVAALEIDVTAAANETFAGSHWDYCPYYSVRDARNVSNCETVSILGGWNK